MTARVTPDEAALQLRTADTLGMPHGPGQPQAFPEALGRRTDSTDLRIFGAARQSADWLDGNDEVAFLPVDIVNSPAVIHQNRPSITINAAISVERGEALAAIAHPAFREILRAAAQRASGGRSPVMP